MSMILYMYMSIREGFKGNRRFPLAECCVCYTNDSSIQTMACNHVVCVHCMTELCKRLSTAICPLCRTPFHQEELKRFNHILFDERSYPSLCVDDWWFISTEHERHMLQHAYTIISIKKQWQNLHYFVVNELEGFAKASVSWMQQITESIGPRGSVESTMRQMHKIAQLGWDRYRTYKCLQKAMSRGLN